MTIIKCYVENTEFPFCSDSGSDLVVFGFNHYRQLCHKLGYEFELEPTNKPAWAANGTKLAFAGKTQMTLASKCASGKYTVYVQKTAMAGHALLSESALINLGYICYDHEGGFALKNSVKSNNSVKSKNSVKLNDSINSIQKEVQKELPPNIKLKISKLFDRYKCCFQGIGRLKNFKAKFYLKTHAPGFVKNCLPIPLHLKKIVQDKLIFLIKNGILEKVPINTPVKYVCSLICIPKKDNGVRICANLKPLNAILETNQFIPTPRIEEFQDKLRTSTVFASMDVRESYFQIELDEQTADLCVISTPIGLLKFKVLPMGASPSGHILDERMSVILQDTNAVNLRDDIIVGSNSLDGLVQECEKVLKACKANGITLNKDKWKFGLEKINFFGMTFSANGMQPSPDKVRDLKLAKFPVNQRGLLSFVCVLEWLQKYILRFASESRCLRDLALTKGPMKATETHYQAFEKLKTAITEDTLLAHFNPNFDTFLFCDAGKTANQPNERGGLCCVVSQKDPKNPDYFIPVCFSSRIMSQVESRYSQTEAECLSVVWGVLRHSYFLEGMTKQFTVFTDCKSLIPMFNKMNQTSCPKRIFNLFLKIQHFSNMSLEYRVGRANPSDFLSRAANQAEPAEDLTESADMELAMVQTIRQTSDKICLALIREATLADPELQNVKKRIIQNDWSHHKKELKAFYSQHEEFYICDDVIFRNGTIVIPQSLRAKVAKLIHDQGHLGMSGTTKLLQQHFWWPGLSQYCISAAQKCHPCQFTQRPKVEKPGGFYIPEPKICYSCSTDWKGPISEFDNYYILSILCLYSGWAEVFYTTTTSFKVLKPILLDYMARHSKIKYLVHDQGPPFMSSEMDLFCKQHNIEQRPVIQYHPQANGVIESYHRSLSKAIARAKILNTNYRTEISEMLLAKMAVPMPGTLKSPHQLVYNKNANLNLLPDYTFPSITDNSGAFQNLMAYKKATKDKHDEKQNVYDRSFHVNDLVLVCENMSLKKKKYSPDLYRVSDVKPSYLVASRLSDGRVVKRHHNHFKIYIPPEDTQQQQPLNYQHDDDEDYDDNNEDTFIMSPPPVPQQRPIRQQEMPPEAPAVPANAVQPPAPVVPQPPPPRRVNFNPMVNIQEIPNNNIGRRITRQMAQVEDHPNVQQGILEASRREQREARQRIDQFQRQENQNQQPIQNQQNDNDQSLIQERHTY